MIERLIDGATSYLMVMPLLFAVGLVLLWVSVQLSRSIGGYAVWIGILAWPCIAVPIFVVLNMLFPLPSL
jgi:hypothetical protein